MQTENYGFTIKYIRARTVHEDDESIRNATFVIMDEMIKRHKAIRVDYTYEKDSLGRIHIHGYMLARKGIRLNLYKKPYWHIHIDHLPTTEDVLNWTRYIHKENDIYPTHNMGMDYMFI